MNSFFKSFTWNSLGTVGRQLLSVALNFVFIRLLTPTDFGLYAMLATVVALSNILLDFGMGVTIVSIKRLTPRIYSAFFWFIFGSGILLTVAIACSGFVLNWFYERNDLVPFALLYSCSYLFLGLGAAPRNLMLRKLNFRDLTLIDFFSLIASSLLGCLIAIDYGVWGLVAKDVFFNAISSILCYIRSGWRPRLFFQYDLIRKHSTFGKLVFFNSFMTYLVSNVDKVIIGKIYGDAILGIYSAVKNLFYLSLKSFIQMFSKVLFPFLARLNRNNVDIGHYFFTFNKILLYSVVPLLALMLVFKEVIVEAAFPLSWERSVLESTITFVLLICFGTITNSCIGPFLQAKMHIGSLVVEALYKKVLILVLIVCGFSLSFQYGIIFRAIGEILASVITIYVAWRLFSMELRSVLRIYKWPVIFVFLQFGFVLLTSRFDHLYSFGFKLICAVIFQFLVVCLFSLVLDRDTLHVFIVLKKRVRPFLWRKVFIAFRI